MLNLLLLMSVVAEGIVILFLIYIITKKAEYDMELESYTDFDGKIINKNIDTYTSQKWKKYSITVKYKFGSITVYDEDCYTGYTVNEKVILRAKVKKNSNGDIIFIDTNNVLVIRDI